MNERIEKRIELKAPPARVWRALTDARELGDWFRVKLDGPFVPGQVSCGYLTYPGCEYIRWEARIQKMEPERLFSFTWPHPPSLERAQYDPDYSGQPTTLVEFRLQEIAGGTLLTITESGFERLPDGRRLEALRRNDGGWSEQLSNIERHVARGR